mmetsp:Transcript_25903/g.66044  ORF Transcript_25903/g.66044 Transcript_25903/m.66044 type:complete len:80 (-) Transcript_25903:123-362(-)
MASTIWSHCCGCFTALLGVDSQSMAPWWRALCCLEAKTHHCPKGQAHVACDTLCRGRCCPELSSEFIAFAIAVTIARAT